MPRHRVHETPEAPVSLVEWQGLADAAALLLTLDAAESRGMTTRKFGVNVGRCRELLIEAESHGVRPRPGPATNAGLLTVLKIPAQETPTPNTPFRIGNNAVMLELKAQRIYGMINMERRHATLDFRVNDPDSNRHGETLAKLHMGDTDLTVEYRREHFFRIDLREMLGQLAKAIGD